MRTINFNEEDIKQCKLALAKQNLTSLQSAFLMQHITNIEQENKQLKMINKEYERLNKENGRGFTITNVQEYDIYELLSYKNYKNNWDKLKEYIKETKLKEFEKSYGKRYGKTFTQAEIIVCNIILDKMQELQGSDSDE